MTEEGDRVCVGREGGDEKELQVYELREQGRRDGRGGGDDLFDRAEGWFGSGIILAAAVLSLLEPLSPAG